MQDETITVRSTMPRSVWIVYFYALGAFFLPIVASFYWIYADQHPPFWDRRSYLTLARAVASAWDTSVSDGIALLARLTSQDYNGYFVLPIWPLLDGQETSLDRYLTALLLLFGPLFYATAFLIGKRLVSPGDRKVWPYALPILVLVPLGWTVSLGGLPDLLPAAALFSAILLFLSYMAHGHWRHLIAGALCLALAMALRRHFAYPAVSALVVLSAAIAWNEWRQTGRYMRALLLGGSASLVAGLVVIAAIAILVPEFLRKAIGQGHLSAYSSYVNPLPVSLHYVFDMGGWALFLLGAAGWILLLRNPTADRRGLIFLGAWLLLWLTIWILGVGYVNAHYFFAIWMAYLSVGLWGIAGWVSRRSHWPRKVGWLALYFLLAACFLFTLFPDFQGRAVSAVGRVFRVGVLPAPYAPSDGSALARYGELLDCISSHAGGKEAAVQVAASSGVLNRDVMLSSYEILKPSARLNFMPVPEVDSRDGSPLPALLQSDIAVAASPFQHHLPAGEQKVVSAANDVFVRPGLISNGYYRKICEVVLPGGVHALAFQRNKPMDGHLFGAFVDAALKSGKPVGPWVIEQDGFEWASAEQQGDSTVLFGNAGTSDRPTIFTMTHRIGAGEDVQLSARVDVLNEACKKALIEPAMLTAEGIQSFDAAGVADGADMHIRFKTAQAGFLQLRVHTGSQDKASMGGCGLRFTPRVDIAAATRN